MADIAPQDTPRTLFPDLPRAEPPPATPGEDGAYRSLSLLALAGFALAAVASVAVLMGGLVPVATRHPSWFFSLLVLSPGLALLASAARGHRDAEKLGRAAGLGLLAWAMLLGIGGLMAYSGSDPWLLNTWFWVVAVLAAIVCWIALARIQASEGTLTGEPLARWGLAASLFFGLIYAAYQSSMSLAVASQARAAAREFIDLAKRSDLLAAFLRTVPPSQRPRSDEGAGARKLAEVHPNDYSAFSASDHIRLLQLAGEDLVATEKSCQIFPQATGYEAIVSYRVDSPACSFDLSVALSGADVPGAGGVRRRSWQILPRATALSPGAPATLKDAAQPLLDAHGPARALVFHWLNLQQAGDRDTPFLLTLPKERRLGAARAAALASPERAAYDKGSLLDDKDAYFSDEKIQAALTPRLRAWLANPGEERGVTAKLTPGVGYPAFEARDGKVRLRFDLQGSGYAGPLPLGQPRYAFDLELVVEGPEGKSAKPEDFRVASLKLVRAKDAPKQGGPGGR